jgi:hypothetical protein
LPLIEVLFISLVSLLLSAKTRRKYPLVLWLTVVLTVLSGYTFRKRSLYRTAFSLLNRVLVLEGSIRGLFLPPLDPQAYLTGLEVVK